MSSLPSGPEIEPLGVTPQGAPAASREQVAALETEIASLRAQVQRLAAALDGHRLLHQVRSVMDWIEQAALRTSPLVSVVLPTRDRRPFLERAIASVEAQSYPNWEVLIVDDSSTDDTASYLAASKLARMRHFRCGGLGACAARNVALHEARGSLIAYLDDDNTMHPQWLKSVVWGFEQRPDATTLYGAFVVDDTARISQKGSGDLPQLYFLPYDHHAIAHENIADMGCIAHRAGLPEAHFDESLRELGDWDLFLRLTREAAPLSLPAIACFYGTDAPHRLSHGPTFAADSLAVRAKNKR